MVEGEEVAEKNRKQEPNWTSPPSRIPGIVHVFIQ